MMRHAIAQNAGNFGTNVFTEMKRIHAKNVGIRY